MSRPAAKNPELLAQLGKVPDAEIAERFGISLAYVCQLRQERNIPPHGPRRTPANRDPEFLAQLGRVSDADLAEQYGLHPRYVRTLRRERGVESVAAGDSAIKTRAGRQPIPIPDDFDPQASVQDEAARHGVSQTLIWNWRRKHVGQTSRAHQRASTPASRNPESVAKDSPTSGPQQRAIPDDFNPTSVARVEAEKYGVSQQTIYRWRQRLGERPVPASEDPQVKADLGTAPDADIAARHGLSQSYVYALRRRAGIAAFVRPPRPSTAQIQGEELSTLGRAAVVHRWCPVHGLLGPILATACLTSGIAGGVPITVHCTRCDRECDLYAPDTESGTPS